MRLKGQFEINIDKLDWKYVALFILLIVSALSNKVTFIHVVAAVWRELK